MKRLIPLLFLITATSPAQILPITEFPLAVGANPHGITTGPDGALWFGEGVPNATGGIGNKIGRITTTGAVTEYPISSYGGTPLTLAAGPDGAIWFTECNGGRIGRITTTGAITEYAVPASGCPYDIVVGSDGALWFAEFSGDKIGRITMAGVITDFAVASGSMPQGIAAGADGALWFTEAGVNKIGRISTTGVITEYAIPSPGGRPVQICAGPDGALWFTEQITNRIGRITAAGAFSMYPIPMPYGSPYAIAAGPDGAVWFEEQGGKIGRISTAGVITDTEVSNIGKGSNSGLTAGPDGALWFTENGNKIGRAFPVSRQNLSSIAGFESGTAGTFPAGWSYSSDGDAFPASVIVTDSQVAHSGVFSARIRRTPFFLGSFSGIIASIPQDFVAKTITLRGYVRTDSVSNAVALWIREDGSSPNLAFASSQGLGVKGTTDWTQYSISLNVVPGGSTIVFGFLLAGTGTAWVDDLEMLADGVPVALAPASVFATDHQFDNGSRISIPSLSNAQIANLATLAKVWGFLKYHHPAVTSGTYHWDYQLFRTMPQVLAATDAATAHAAISAWIASLGPVTQCSPCATLTSGGLALNPDLDWISDTALLGAGLSQTLTNIYKNRPAGASQAFISLVPNVGNPSFDNELSYPYLKLPDAGYQLLALFRFWNMVQYFYPNRNAMADDGSANYWNSVLVASIPRIALAADRLSYQQELMRFIGMINDTHANLWSSIASRPPIGTCQLPVNTRFVEGVPVIDRYLSQSAGAASGLLVGDVIEQLDGVAVSDLVNQWTPFYGDSNQAARLRDIGQYMTRGACGAATVVVRRRGLLVSVNSTRVTTSSLDLTTIGQHDLEGPAFQSLSKDVAYLKLSSVTAANSANYVQSAAGTKGLIIDIRNYPAEFVVFTLGSLLVSQPTNFVRFTFADVANPGAFRWQGAPLAVPAQSPHYSGKVVILVDETTQSQAEYTAMAFRTAPGALVIGSTTAGADGNVSTVPLPGGLSSLVSGFGVFYPDGKPTQRVGIVPDIQIQPTLLGIQTGRDELIDEAIRQITGSSAPRPVISLVANAEGETPTIAPNTWVEIKGSNLAPAGDTRIWTGADLVNGNLPVQLDGVSATVNGKSAYVYYISPTQVNILTPPDMISGSVAVVLNNNGAVSAPYAVQSQAAAPTFFVASGSYVLATHADGSLLGPASLSAPGYAFTPAKPGETIVLYGNGFGPTSSPFTLGSAEQSGTLAVNPVITIGGTTAEVKFAGLIFPGEFQFNVVVPLGTADGDQPIKATYNGVATQSGMVLAVQH